MTLLDCLEHTPGGPVDSSIIWLHGLGASGYDFAPLVPHLGLSKTRFVFPHAPKQPVTLNGGFEMPSWYDIRSLDRSPDRESEEDIRAMQPRIEALIQREVDRGVPSERIVLAGFSQGAAMTLFTGTRTEHPLAGLMVLSGYLVVPNAHDAEQSDANRATPILVMHGDRDETVPVELGKHAHERIQEGRASAFKTYAMGHEVNGPQIQDIKAWIHARLSA